MRVYLSPNHRLRNVKTELHNGVVGAPFEKPERVEFIENELKRRGGFDIVEPNNFSLETVTSVHRADYVDFVRTIWQDWQDYGLDGEAIPNIWPSRSMPSDRPPEHPEGKIGYYALAAETAISAGTYEAALSSKDSAVSAVQYTLTTEQPSFALCRPPGHHAAHSQFGGYCFFNNAAIAAQYARDNFELVNKVAILDVDYHHGNGTQEIFFARNDVYTLSIHGEPQHAFPYFLGYDDEIGIDEGAGFNQNYPLPLGADFAVWREALLNACERIALYQPDMLLVSLGVDTFEDDPISKFRLKSEDFLELGRIIAGLRKKTVFVMEGGYAVAEIGINVANVLEGFEAV